MSTGRIIEARLGRRAAIADGALAILVVGVVALMVVPLPTWLLDVLLATNLAVSIAILLVTLYVGRALELTSFPTLVLITTLVRVALNVSSTRLILLHADAGQVIRAFGSFVVSGNFVVGAVVFLIITVIQFVVVARGSERVAEVAARFVLDALPGKQLAIDAELRAGTLERDAADARRRHLEIESQFYGAMDGAAKFVKGDAVATLVIALINIVGGVAIGVGQHGLDLTSALHRYGLLTIGDGLVTQLPALLIATAAGILVTRVPSEEGEAALGVELGTQLLRAPRALGAAGVVVSLLAVVPGLPAAPLLVTGVALFAASRFGHHARTVKNEQRRVEGSSSASGLGGFVPEVLPWSMDVSRDLSVAFRDALATLPERLRERVFRTLGVVLPPCRVEVDDELPDGNAVLSIREVPAAVFELSSRGGPHAVARLEARVALLLLDRAADFLGISETKALLDRLESVAPATVRQVVPKVIDVATLSDVLRHLVEEGLGIRDLRAILEALVRAPSAERDAASLTEHVRRELRRALTWELTAGAGVIDVVMLDASIEDAIRGAIHKTASGTFLTLSPAATTDISAAVQEALTKLDPRSDDAPAAILLTRPDLRRFVRRLLEPTLPRLRVVASTELLPEIRLNCRAQATLIGR
ncbi:MAG TPA: flagellar biosynthesis protein FlhA [Polyangiaceae bacterium]|jgi:type III secretion protein V|nr:flagellar biosynthesis protein FlhA [Polyangiaceae bacterium]